MPDQASTYVPARPIHELIEDPKATQILPSLSLILQELERMIGHSHIPIQEISRIIRRDQSMALKVLRLANSAYFAPTTPIVNVDESIIYLGLGQVKRCILTAQCIEKTCHVSPDLMNWKDFWLHSVAVGCIAQTLATNLDEKVLPTESYYIMGLLHDIGKLVLAFLAPQDLEHVLKIAQERETTMHEVEIELFGIDHSGLGSWYIQQQGLPASFFQPIRMHHAVEYSVETSIDACILNLADRLTHSIAVGFSGSFLPDDDDPFQSPSWEQYAGTCKVGFPSEQHLKEFFIHELDQLPPLFYGLLS